MLPRSLFLYHSTCHRSFIYLLHRSKICAQSIQRVVVSSLLLVFGLLSYLEFLILIHCLKTLYCQVWPFRNHHFKKNNSDICWIFLEFQICCRPLPLAIAEYWIRIYYKTNGKLIKYIVFFFFLP